MRKLRKVAADLTAADRELAGDGGRGDARGRARARGEGRVVLDRPAKARGGDGGELRRAHFREAKSLKKVKARLAHRGLTPSPGRRADPVLELVAARNRDVQVDGGAVLEVPAE